jgi:diadenosine tetraphosphatase ApaH/serine/threonine PP2A family protein phosphatase
MLALLADIHSNLEALRACLAHARDGGATRYAFLGDLVGYGADPAAVVKVVRRYAAEGAVVVQGNHDASVAKYAGAMSEDAQDGVRWTRGVLGAGEIAWLGSLPLCIREERRCFVHASAASPRRWEYVDNPAAAKRCAEAASSTWTFAGHFHRQVLFFAGRSGTMTSFVPVPGTPVPTPGTRRWVAIVGSVGQPRERNPAAAYALFDPVRETITFQRVPYDHLTAARKVRDAGLADLFALRTP